MVFLAQKSDICIQVKWHILTNLALQWLWNHITVVCNVQIELPLHRLCVHKLIAHSYQRVTHNTDATHLHRSCTTHFLILFDFQNRLTLFMLGAHCFHVQWTTTCPRLHFFQYIFNIYWMFVVVWIGIFETYSYWC